jgi:hypothetical protein
MVTVEIFKEIEDPGPRPLAPGNEPENFHARMAWREQWQAIIKWEKANRRFQLAILALKIQEISPDCRTSADDAIIVIASMLLADVATGNDVMAELLSPFGVGL